VWAASLVCTHSTDLQSVMVDACQNNEDALKRLVKLTSSQNALQMLLAEEDRAGKLLPGQNASTVPIPVTFSTTEIPDRKHGEDFMTLEGFVNLSRVRREDGGKEHPSESRGRISGDFGDFAPCDEPCCELFAKE
jgi:hypothetical protein